MRSIKFLDYPISNKTKVEFVQEIVTMSQDSRVHLVTVLNANKMYLYDKYTQCMKSVNESTLVLPENAINIGMKWLRTPLKEWDVGGVMIAKELLKEESLKIFLLGAKQITLEKIMSSNNFNNIVGFHHGYFREKEVPEIVESINQSQANIILLGLGSPRQEIMMQIIRPILHKGVMIGVGGTLDVLSGIKKHAPRWTRYGLEWMYYVFQDPKKFKRYFIVNTYFIYQFITHILFQNKK